ncbi:MAG: 6-bladed beta-propeller [Candidatus Saccharimonas sp.]|nr:6-bladed beta-propeller [Planctomycetaceae bacterium]
MSRSLSFAVLMFVCCAATDLRAAEPYVSTGFLPLPADIEIGPMSAVAVDGPDRVYVLHRGEPPLLVLDGQHKLIAGWGKGEFKTPHGLRVDAKGNVWVTDNARHVIYRMSREGQVTLTLGTLDKGGAGPTQLRSPDDLVFDSKGLIYVADAGNKRIAKFDADGKYLAEWGKGGKEPGQFSTAHGLAIDSKDRIYVADRGNRRVQVFNTEGQFQAAWTEAGNPFGLLVTGEGLIVADGDAHRLTLLDFDGKSLGAWGSPETLKLPHLMAINSSGTVYVTEVDGKRIQLFRRAK